MDHRRRQLRLVRSLLRPGLIAPEALWVVGLAIASTGLWLAISPASDPPGAFAAVADKVPTATNPSTPTTVRFGRDIRPILSDRCFKCHGPDAATRMAGLRLDDRNSAVGQGGGGGGLIDGGGIAAIVPGKASQSEMWRRITADDPHDIMPPPKAGKKPLSVEEKEAIRQWIDAGAQYEQHWAFTPPKASPPPQVKNSSWCRNDIDRYVLAALEREGIAPSPEADRPTLVRRVFLDLTGLPPTPQESDAFLADTSPDAYEKLIDRLFAEEPYRTRTAERLAAPWLDAARYADTSGIHMDAGRQMWLWRDWVLAAYRDNMPFDQFVTEQLAGDLMPNATDDQKIASGFNRNHVTTDEGGAIAEEYLAEYAAERTATTGSVFLGLTLGCARCHDHKFDPVSQADFYSMFAFFNSIEEPGLYSQVPDNKRALEPFLIVPTAAQLKERAELATRLAAVNTEINKSTPEEDAQRAEFFKDLPTRTGLAWQPSSIVSTTSTAGSTLTVQDDLSILATGKNPDADDFQIKLRTDAVGLRMISLEALADPSLGKGRVGRAINGNAVMSGFTAEAVSIADPAQRTPISFVWAWADIEQRDGDHRIVNTLHAGDGDGWAVAGHQFEGDRLALYLADKPFGYEGGTEVVITLQFHSKYAQHTLGRVRLALGSISDQGLSLLPTSSSAWYFVGPFTPAATEEIYKKQFGPEEGQHLDFTRNFGAGNQFWKYAPAFADERLNNDLPQGVSVSYVAKRLFSPNTRHADVSLGSDDGFALYLAGKEVAAHEIGRGLAADQDKAAFELVPGENTIVFKIVNTLGPGGFFWRLERENSLLPPDLVQALAPTSAQNQTRRDKADTAWKLTFSSRYKAMAADKSAIEKRTAEVEMAAPKTMVMKELPKPRETFVLKRGVFDKPDLNHPVQRAVPSSLGKIAPGDPQDRLGLAHWIVSGTNPLTARVTVNRFWEMIFGNGIVRTTEDFGFQGDWPSHPELLDYLAIEFQSHAWDQRRMLREIMTSATYRQTSRTRPELANKDPENRLLASFPRRRLSAEQIRDQALYVSGLLVEQAGGPSVKSYQPEGLWQEVAMPQSNTRIYERGNGPDLWRRSIYTYWKRAAPPPSLMTFDAPTRESCTIRRLPTNTPLQALVLWNDVQYVEASRLLAQRTLLEPGDDAAHLTTMFRRCTGRNPEATELAAITAALEQFRQRYQSAPEDAAKLLMSGDAPRDKALPDPELAAWTLIANALLNLDATITKG